MSVSCCAFAATNLLNWSYQSSAACTVFVGEQNSEVGAFQPKGVSVGGDNRTTSTSRSRPAAGGKALPLHESRVRRSVVEHVDLHGPVTPLHASPSKVVDQDGDDGSGAEPFEHVAPPQPLVSAARADHQHVVVVEADAAAAAADMTQQQLDEELGSGFMLDSEYEASPDANRLDNEVFPHEKLTQSDAENAATNASSSSSSLERVLVNVTIATEDDENAEPEHLYVLSVASSTPNLTLDASAKQHAPVSNRTPRSQCQCNCPCLDEPEAPPSPTTTVVPPEEEEEGAAAAATTVLWSSGSSSEATIVDEEEASTTLTVETTTAVQEEPTTTPSTECECSTAVVVPCTTPTPPPPVVLILEGEAVALSLCGLSIAAAGKLLMPNNKTYALLRCC